MPYYWFLNLIHLARKHILSIIISFKFEAYITANKFCASDHSVLLSIMLSGDQLD
jgi:hypothetical protein